MKTLKFTLLLLIIFTLTINSYSQPLFHFNKTKSEVLTLLRADENFEAIVDGIITYRDYDYYYYLAHDYDEGISIQYMFNKKEICDKIIVYISEFKNYKYLLTTYQNNLIYKEIAFNTFNTGYKIVKFKKKENFWIISHQLFSL